MSPDSRKEEALRKITSVLPFLPYHGPVPKLQKSFWFGELCGSWYRCRVYGSLASIIITVHFPERCCGQVWILGCWQLEPWPWPVDVVTQLAGPQAPGSWALLLLQSLSVLQVQGFLLSKSFSSLYTEPGWLQEARAETPLEPVPSSHLPAGAGLGGQAGWETPVDCRGHGLSLGQA